MYVSILVAVYYDYAYLLKYEYKRSCTLMHTNTHTHSIAPPKIAEKPPPPKVAEKPRKVAEKPPPLSVAEEPDREESPETLSFREKLALHKNAADNQGVGVQRPPSRPQSAREQSREVYSPPRDTAMRQTSLDMSISPQGTVCN